MLRTTVVRSAAQPGRRLVSMVTEAGLTGRGGAAFPTGTKMRSVGMRRGPKFVVANGVEGEPASEKDQAILARAPHLVSDGAVLVAPAVGADTVPRLAPLADRRSKMSGRYWD